jgi:hypothetical protein
MNPRSADAGTTEVKREATEHRLRAAHVERYVAEI